ncbi:telomere repeat-binding factor 1-like isoform X3 [Nicotiana sylvestris]|uniref:telomere repeat-binding factor 1-like isoform X3 n=1 Tax=Nicotiana sylvestris TaxID=4096 RepID=UPI00388C7394
MGAPKQKWTSEEEAALKAGILKHGPGKWRTILKDPEFSGVLCLRSNVDLKDKWRNMTVMANGWSSREQARLAVKRTKQAPRQDGSPVADTTTAESDEEAAEAQAATTSSGSPQIHGSRKAMIRLDNLIMEAISSLKEPGGSNKTTIAAYIEDQYWAPPNFIRLLSGKLKYLTATGKLIKIKRKYRVAPTSTPSDRRRNLSSPFLDSRQRIFSKVDRDYMDMLSTSQIDLEIANKMRNMTPQEAAAAAAQAVAEAEAAIAEAEEAARDAEAHEADAEAAKAFSDATKTLHGRSAPRMAVMHIRKMKVK